MLTHSPHIRMYVIFEAAEQQLVFVSHSAFYNITKDYRMKKSIRSTPNEWRMNIHHRYRTKLLKAHQQLSRFARSLSLSRSLCRCRTSARQYVHVSCNMHRAHTRHTLFAPTPSILCRKLFALCCC